MVVFPVWKIVYLDLIIALWGIGQLITLVQALVGTKLSIKVRFRVSDRFSVW